MGLQVQDKDTGVSRGKGEDVTKDQEPWIGVVPVDMDDNKASTGNQESFADAMVNKVRARIWTKTGRNSVSNRMDVEWNQNSCFICFVKDEAGLGSWSICADHSGSQPKHHQWGNSAQIRCTKWPVIPCCGLRMQETSALVSPRQIWLRCSPSPSLWSRRPRTSPSSSGLFWGTQNLVVVYVQGQGWRSLTKKHAFVSLVMSSLRSHFGGGCFNVQWVWGGGTMILEAKFYW